MPTQARQWGIVTQIVVHILHDLHLQAGDEAESGPNVSQVTGPEESAARPHISPIPTFGKRGSLLGAAPPPWTPCFHRFVDEIVDDDEKY